MVGSYVNIMNIYVKFRLFSDCLKINLFLLSCMCVCVWGYAACVQVPAEPEEGAGSHVGGVTGSCELPNMGAGN